MRRLVAEIQTEGGEGLQPVRCGSADPGFGRELGEFEAPDRHPRIALQCAGADHHRLAGRRLHDAAVLGSDDSPCRCGSRWVVVDGLWRFDEQREVGLADRRCADVAPVVDDVRQMDHRKSHAPGLPGGDPAVVADAGDALVADQVAGAVPHLGDRREDEG